MSMFYSAEAIVCVVVSIQLNANLSRLVWGPLHNQLHWNFCKLHCTVYKEHFLSTPLHNLFIDLFTRHTLCRHHNEAWIPTLRLLHQFPFLLTPQRVDKGAIKFVLSGANIMCPGESKKKLDLAFNNVKPKDWYYVLDWVRFRTELRCVRLYFFKIVGWMDQ